jgi:hypothetical protein
MADELAERIAEALERNVADVLAALEGKAVVDGKVWWVEFHAADLAGYRLIPTDDEETT